MKLDNGKTFFGRYDKKFDGRRLCLPSEWARIFRAGGVVVAVGLSNGKLALTTKKHVESAKEETTSRIVPCRMDERGRVAIPEAFRMIFDGVTSVMMTGMVHYVEVCGKEGC